jgi:hypothetical protein
VHDVDDEDGDVAQRRAAGPKIAEALVARGVDHQQARDAHLEVPVLVELW